MNTCLRTFVPCIALLLPLALASPSQADLLQVTGELTFLRVHELGSGWGPPSDFLDVELVIRVDNAPGRAMGFQLRDDAALPARQGMLDLLRDAFNNGWTVVIDYGIDAGRSNGTLLRVALVK